MPASRFHLVRVLRIAALMTLLAALAVAAVPAQAASVSATGALSITLASGNGATVGQSLPMMITATNTTANPINSVTLGATFSQAAAKLVAPLPNPDACGRIGGGGTDVGFSCSFLTVQPGVTVSVLFTLQPLVAGTLTVGGFAAGDVGGGIFNTTGAQLSIPVAPAPTDVQVSGSASTGSPARGANFFYTFQVKNGGSQPAYGVTFTDTVPAGLTPVSASTNTGAACALSSGTVTCTLGDLAVGAQANVTINVTAPTTAMTLTDTGTANDTNGDTQPSNNSASVTVQIK